MKQHKDSGGEVQLSKFNHCKLSDYSCEKPTHHFQKGRGSFALSAGHLGR